MVAHFVTDFEGHPAVIARPLIANGNGTISSYHVLLMEKWLINGLAMMARNETLHHSAPLASNAAHLPSHNSIQGSSLVIVKSKYTCTTFSQLIDDSSSKSQQVNKSKVGFLNAREMQRYVRGSVFFCRF